MLGAAGHWENFPSCYFPILVITMLVVVVVVGGGCFSGFFNANGVSGLRRAASPPRLPRSPISNRLGPAFHIEPPSKLLFSNDTGELSKKRGNAAATVSPLQCSTGSFPPQAPLGPLPHASIRKWGVFLYCPNFLHSLILLRERCGATQCNHGH